MLPVIYLSFMGVMSKAEYHEPTQGITLPIGTSDRQDTYNPQQTIKGKELQGE